MKLEFSCSKRQGKLLQSRESPAMQGDPESSLAHFVSSGSTFDIEAPVLESPCGDGKLQTVPWTSLRSRIWLAPVESEALKPCGRLISPGHPAKVRGRKNLSIPFVTPTRLKAAAGANPQLRGRQSVAKRHDPSPDESFMDPNQDFLFLVRVHMVTTPYRTRTSR